tara:strand:- start:1678 stop:2505 length:828 start_codon:yes stop_codon:yes gene_type:complete
MNIRRKENLSVAIPTYNSSKYIDKLLGSILKNDHVKEVVLSDDNSDKVEKESYLQCVDKFQKKYPEKKIKFFDNYERRGPFINKYNAVSNCTNDIVYQIDSDNMPMINFNNFIGSDLIKSFNKNNIYLPSKIYQFYNMPTLSIPLSKIDNGTKYRIIFQDENFEFDKNIIKKSILDGIKITKEKNVRWLINIGNFIVDRNSFVSAMSEGFSYPEKLLFAADQFLISYLWLKNKNNLEVRKKHYHFHRKRQDSVSFEEKDNTGESFKIIEDKILDL